MDDDGYMTRKELNFPEYTLDCSFGKVYLTPLSMESAHVGTKSQDEPIIVNGVGYTFSTTLYAHQNWDIDRAKGGWYIRRKDWLQSGKDYATDAAHKRITEEVRKRAILFLSEHVGVLGDAEWIRRNNEIEALQQDEEKLISQLRIVRKQQADKEMELASFREPAQKEVRV